MTATIDDNAAPTIRGEVGATVLGPDNVPIGAQNPGAPDTGWALRLAVEDADEGLAWALSATDTALA